MRQFITTSIPSKSFSLHDPRSSWLTPGEVIKVYSTADETTRLATVVSVYELSLMAELSTT
jgi:hypothetical protein